MSDEGDAQRWRPVSNESGIEPDDPTGPMPAVTGEEPGFPPVSDEAEAWSAETTSGFPASPERSPFEPADPSPAEEQSFSALRRSLAERLARYTEPEGGWPDPPSPDPTPPFGTTTAGESAHAEGSPAEDPPPAPEEPPSYGFGEQTVHDSTYDEEKRQGSPYETAQGSSFADRSSYDAEETAQRSSFTDGYGAEETAQGSSFTDYGAEETAQRSSFTEGSSYGAEETLQGSSFTNYGAEETDQKSSLTDGSYGGAEETFHRSSYGLGEETVHDSPYGFAERTVHESPAAEQDSDNEFFGSDEHQPVWDKVVAPTGPPPQPGKPSSGNMRLPDWMKDGGTEPPGEQEEPRRSRVPLYSGIGVLVLGLLAAGGVAVLKKGGDTAAPPVDRATSPTAAAPPRAPREKVLARFRGPHTRAAGRIADRRAGLTYPRLSSPWTLAPKKSPMSEIGFSVSQFTVTERAAGRPKRWGRLMSAELAGAERSAYDGPGTERAAALQVADLLEARMYAFRHRKRPLASQPLNVGGHKGWLIGSYVTYHRPGVRATAEVFTVAVVDTGRGTPGVLCMTVPNTDRRLWPDVNYVMRALRVL